MNDLIKALQILSKYDRGLAVPTYCEDKILYVNVDPKIVNMHDLLSLRRLSFIADEFTPAFCSNRFGGL